MDEPIRSIDELFAEFSKAVERMDFVKSLMRDHANARPAGHQAIHLFADLVGKGVHDMREYLTEIKLAMDIEGHKGR
jgi:hypothetical protein